MDKTQRTPWNNTKMMKKLKRFIANASCQAPTGEATQPKTANEITLHLRDDETQRISEVIDRKAGDYERT